jgi:hypothetical protein
MGELKIVILSKNDNQCSKLIENLHELSLNNILVTRNPDYLNNYELDFIFLDVAFLGSEQTISLVKDIEVYIGKPYLIINSEENLKKNRSEFQYFKKTTPNYITTDITKLDLLNEIIDALNKFNNNRKIKDLKCYDFLYLVTDKIEIKKIEMDSILEIFNDNDSVYIYMKFNNDNLMIKIINMNFSSLFKSLTKDFIKIDENNIINKGKVVNIQPDIKNKSKFKKMFSIEI